MPENGLSSCFCCDFWRHFVETIASSLPTVLPSCYYHSLRRFRAETARHERDKIGRRGIDPAAWKRLQQNRARNHPWP